jgi:twitching motility protein PilT
MDQPAAPVGQQQRQQPPQQELSLRALLQETIQRGASDLHLTVGNPAMMRIDGDLTKSNTGQVLAPKDTLALSYTILTENQKKRFEV